MAQTPEQKGKRRNHFEVHIPKGLSHVRVDFYFDAPPEDPAVVAEQVRGYAHLKEYRGLISSIGELTSHIFRLKLDDGALGEDTHHAHALDEFNRHIWLIDALHTKDSLHMFQTAFNQLMHSASVRDRDPFDKERLKTILDKNVQDALNNPPAKK